MQKNIEKLVIRLLIRKKGYYQKMTRIGDKVYQVSIKPYISESEQLNNLKSAFDKAKAHDSN